ncbi:MAG: hypothetical protein WCV67_08750 [Victivallaceae bacterium]|jgi:alpha-L-arabinofuranosidase
MKRINLIRYGLIGLLAAGIGSLTASGAEPSGKTTDAITVTTSPEGTPIRLISGGNLEFFAPPIRQKMKDPDLLSSWQKIPFRMLRFPGGTVCDHYIWNDPSAGYFIVGNASTVITPAQFITMCRTIGAEPIFQVNTMSVDRMANRINPNNIEMIRKGAQRAAEWVRDANIKNQWNVKYWEIGNEVWIWLFPEEYAKYVVEYSKAMKTVDPTIKIIACGLSSKVGPFNPDSFFNFSKIDPNWKPRTAVTNDAVSWNDALLTIADGCFDYLAPHPYASGNKSTTDVKKLYLETTAKVWQNEGMKSQYDALQRHPSSKARIAITEWACNFGASIPGSSGKLKPDKAYYYMLGNGINMAFYFGRFLEDTRNEIAIVHSLSDIQTLWYWPKKEMAQGEPLAHPSILGLQVWGNNLGDKRMSVQSGAVPDLAIGGERVPAVYFFASEDDACRYLVAINLDPDHATRVIWKTAGAGAATVSLLAGKSLDTQNFDDWGKSKKAVEIETSALMPADGAYVLDLPRHSMAGVKVKK